MIRFIVAIAFLVGGLASVGVLVTQAHTWRQCRPGERPNHGDSSVAVALVNGKWKTIRPVARTEGC